MKQIFLATFIVVCFYFVGSVGFSSSNSSQGFFSAPHEMDLQNLAKGWQKYRGIEFERGIQGPLRITRICVLVNTDNAPIEILSFGEGGYASGGFFSGEVEYKNRTERDIEALAITIIWYDVFNDEQGFKRDISVFPAPFKTGEESLTSLYLEAGDISIVKTVMVFVSAVRFLDGEVWKADMQQVLKIARDIPQLSFLSEI